MVLTCNTFSVAKYYIPTNQGCSHGFGVQFFYSDVTKPGLGHLFSGSYFNHIGALDTQLQGILPGQKVY